MPSLLSYNGVQSFVAENSSGVRLNQKCCNKNCLTLLKRHKHAQQAGLLGLQNHFSEPSSHLSCFLFFVRFCGSFQERAIKGKKFLLVMSESEEGIQELKHNLYLEDNVHLSAVIVGHAAGSCSFIEC